MASIGAFLATNSSTFSEYWYKTKADNLTKMQAAGIAAILPNPRKYKASNSSSYIQKRKGKIVKTMRQIGKIEY